MRNNALTMDCACWAHASFYTLYDINTHDSKSPLYIQGIPHMYCLSYILKHYCKLNKL